jgi:hypothetical protein
MRRLNKVKRIKEKCYQYLQISNFYYVHNNNNLKKKILKHRLITIKED